MRLRNLELKDATNMLEWMHDKEVTQFLYSKFCDKTLDDAREFISNSYNDKNIHLAIVSDEDEYMGTVSLKNISDSTAEFGITVRSTAMSKGYAWYGMETMLNKAFDEYGLDSVYWCVRSSNERAIRFYEKHSFHETLDIPKIISERYSDAGELKWYSALKGDVFEVKERIAGCRVVKINTISTVNAGELSFFEEHEEVDFDIKRIYYITKVPEGVRRGFHAHKSLKQILFCPYGRIQLILDDGEKREEIELRDPSIGVVIDEPIWREMLWLKKDSVLCVAASELYDPSDYIRDYDEYLEFIKGRNN